MKYVCNDREKERYCVRFYYFGKYIKKKVALDMYLKGSPLFIEPVEPYPIELKTTIYQFQLSKELYEAGKSV